MVQLNAFNDILKVWWNNIMNLCRQTSITRIYLLFNRNKKQLIFEDNEEIDKLFDTHHNAKKL